MLITVTCAVAGIGSVAEQAIVAGCAGGVELARPEAIAGSTQKVLVHSEPVVHGVPLAPAGVVLVVVSVVVVVVVVLVVGG